MGEQTKFATKLGIIATTVGSAVGLGNIWRFPYEAGMNGGGAFLMVYILCVLILGIPVMCAEFVIGRRSKSDTVDAFRKLAPGTRWHYIGYIGILASVLILGYYMVISGWTLEYLFKAFTNDLAGKTAAEFKAEQNAFIQSDFRPLLWAYIFLFINYIILSRGVQKGIEKMSNILMPLLFVILVVFCVRSLTLPGSSKGLSFFLHPDFSKITPQVIIRAMGQAFFSLSLGMGILITYSSYFNAKTHLIKTATTVALLDTSVAILAGVIIFPAMFACGLNPATDSASVVGPDLVFVTLPNVFNQMPVSTLWSVLFFLLLTVAALTSTVSLFEVTVAFLINYMHMSRKKATRIMMLIVAVLSTIFSLSIGSWSQVRILGKTIFDACDYFSAIILLPVGGLLISIFIGWVLKRHISREELTNRNKLHEPLFNAIFFSIKYIAPIIIILIFLSGFGII
ncbi:sodium-dependent transporter [Barnesiella sp. An55]|uniref:sodium-dependent transporter n=1 Tax=Barnesiella sp. An55 TaxID=1965646 RepID=UPI000B3922B5|nr:sodium-dependent transporter [Barnesiella sp. An55]OUN73404.1 sodium-dependent transporter [Barnesiella sp. An55]HIZ25928.1 sodium-dependent transporter [Candidatus Barnesiella merdipullorum]